MVAPLIGAALIGGGASLIGGAMQSSAINKANKANRPVNQVREWEEAGINPLWGIANGNFIPHQANTAIGDSVAKAGGIFADAIAMGEEQELRNTQLDLENELLKKQLDQLAKPIEPSHMDSYGGLLPLPSNGGVNAASSENLSLDAVRADGREISAERKLRVVTPYGVVETDPRWTPAEQIEDEYGEPAAWLYSGVRAVDAIADTVTGPLAQGYLDHIGKPFANWMMSIGDNHGVADVRPVTDRDPWAGTVPRSIGPTQREIDSFEYRRSVIGGWLPPYF